MILYKKINNLNKIQPKFKNNYRAYNKKHLKNKKQKIMPKSNLILKNKAYSLIKKKLIT